MSRGRGAAPVVVGVDSGCRADDAVEWAAAEAAASGVPLLVVHAFRPPLPADPYGVVPAMDDHGIARTVAEQVLGEAMARARSVTPDVEVSARLLVGPASRVLLHAARRARLVVLGSRGLCGWKGLLARSVSAHVAARASCPVVVIHPSGGGDTGGGSSRVPARVVVGVDGTSAAQPAIGFALDAARQRGIPVVAVHAWTADAPADLEAVSGLRVAAEAAARATVEHVVAGWRETCTSVPVVVRMVAGAPAEVLVAESAGAAMVVVGSRGRSPVLGAVLGSVSRTVLSRAGCPVAIIRRSGGVGMAPPARSSSPAS